MTIDDELLIKLGKEYQRVLDMRKNEDYVVNEVQMYKLLKIIDFFQDAVKNMGGKMEPVRLVPKEIHGGVTASFILFDITGDEVARFCDVMKGCSAISIDEGGDDGVCISCSVPNIYVRKPKDLH